jgi:D-serine deaminase-like pyridoxal phosphate-dependent protein
MASTANGAGRGSSTYLKGMNMAAGVLDNYRGSTAKLAAAGVTPLVEEPHLKGWTFGATATKSRTATNSTGGYTTGETGVVTIEGTLTYLMHDGEVAPIKIHDILDVELYVGAVAAGNYYSGEIIITAGPKAVEADLEDPAPFVALEYDWECRGAIAATGDVAPLPT